MKNYRQITIAKGIGILFVVIGHAMTNEMRIQYNYINFIFNWIYSFHMPLFMFISGYLFEINYVRYREEGTWKFLTKKAKNYIVPYITYSLLVYVAIFVLKHIYLFDSILGAYEVDDFYISIKQILFCQDNLDRHIWFVYVLFLIQIVFYLFRGIPKKNIYLAALCVLLFLGGFIHRYFEIPYISGRILNYSLFFMIGGVYKRYEELVKKADKYIFIAFLAASIVFSIISIEFIHVELNKSFLYFSLERAVGILGSVAIVEISNNVFCALFDKLSKYSFEIYLFHQPFFTAGSATVLMRVIGCPLIILPIATVIGICLSIVGASILKKNKYTRIMFGLKRKDA